MQFLSADPVAATADYRRRARRIRANFSGDPLSRQRALGELATQRNAELQVSVVAETTGLQSKITSVIERGFSEHAAAKLQPFGFTFSDRLKLLDAAERLGLSRFRANMILALLEHQAPDRRFPTPEIPVKSFAPSLIAVLSVEIVIIGALVLLCSL